jgi:transposase
MSKQYDKEFKIQTVRMIQEQGKSVAQAARELGIAENTLYRWVSEYKARSGQRFPRQRQSENRGKDRSRIAEANSTTRDEK